MINNEIEIWKAIPKHKGYEVSNKGRVRSINRIMLGKDGINRKFKGRVLSLANNGRMQASLGNNTKPIRNNNPIRVSILVMMAFKGYLNDDSNLVVDHIDNNRSNDDLDNLQIITQRENLSKNRNPISGFTGVSKINNKWRAQIAINGTKLIIGAFNTPEEASEAYQTKLKEHIDGYKRCI